MQISLIFLKGVKLIFLNPYEKSDDTFLYQTDPALSNGAISRILGHHQFEISVARTHADRRTFGD